MTPIQSIRYTSPDWFTTTQILNARVWAMYFKLTYYNNEPELENEGIWATNGPSEGRPNTKNVKNLPMFIPISKLEDGYVLYVLDWLKERIPRPMNNPRDWRTRRFAQGNRHFINAWYTLFRCEAERRKLPETFLEWSKRHG